MLLNHPALLAALGASLLLASAASGAETRVATLPNGASGGEADSAAAIWKAYGSAGRTNAARLVLQALKTAPGDLPLLRGITSYGWEVPQRFAAALPLLDQVVQLDHPASWRSTWALANAGYAHYGLGDYAQARTALDSALKLHSSPEMVAYAQQAQRLLGFSEVYSNWTTLETAHFRFHFSPGLWYVNGGHFARKHETYFEAINQFFHAELAKKIDYSVKPGNECRAWPCLAVVHAHPWDQGHEMTHVLCQQALQPIQTTSLVEEGVAVYFDQSRRARFETARRAVHSAKWDTVSIAALWQERAFWKNPFVSYRVGAALIERLRSKGGDAKLKALLHEQTLEAARRIYGPELDTWLTELEQQLQEGNPFILGFILFALGLVTWIAGEVRLLVLAYRRSLVWFFGCLFVPFVSWMFFLVNVKQAWKAVVLATTGLVVTGIGYWAGGFQFLR